METLLRHAFTEYDNREDVQSDIVLLAKKEINPCAHCNWCVKNQEEGKFCRNEDDMSEIYPLVHGSNGMIIASPVHFGRLSGTTADFIDRLRPFVHGNLYRGTLRNKIGGSLAVAWFRHAGVETTLNTINYLFFAVNMIIASPDLGFFGTGAFSSPDGTGRREKSEKLQVTDDPLDMASARSLAYRVWELAKIVEEGSNALS